jgi:hypothetical protein
MSTQIKNAPTTSAQLEIRLLNLKASRDAMSDELTRALTTLEAAQSAITLEDATTIERASTAQARAVVLQNAEIALNEQVFTLEGELSAAIASEERARGLAQLATLRADLEEENAALEAKSRDFARAHQDALTELLGGFRRSAETATQLQFKAMETNTHLPLDEGLGFNEARFTHAVAEEVEPCVIHFCALTLQALRSAQHIREHGVSLYRESEPVNSIPRGVPHKSHLPEFTIKEAPVAAPHEPVSMATNEMNDSLWVTTKVAEDRQRNGGRR